MDRLLKELPPAKNINELIQQQEGNPKVVDSLLKWQANRAQLSKLNEMLHQITQYTKQRAALTRSTDDYITVVNKFLIDSGKQLVFDDRGSLAIKIEALADYQQITALSSGEAQIFVILTHLFFNPLAQKANVFIIDEPELSLHIQWQELFVDSLVAANPAVQYIMSTHSPSIILDRLENCRDVTLRAKKRGSK